MAQPAVLHQSRGLQTGGRKEKATQKGGVWFMLLLCTLNPSPHPLASSKHPVQQCNSATGLSPGAGTAAEIFRFLAIHPSHLTLLPAVPQHICITNFPLEVVLFLVKQGV